MKKENNCFDEIDRMLYEYFNNNVEVPIGVTNTIKNALHKKKRNRKPLVTSIASLFAVFLLTTGVVFAKEIKDFFKDTFNLASIDIKNDSVVDAIESNEYIQNVEMDYIALNEDYKIKADYLMMDDVNLYIVFNLYSSNDVKSTSRLSILDLAITGNDGSLIYSTNELRKANGSLVANGWKGVSAMDNEVRELLFVISDNFNKTENLNIKFSRIAVYNSAAPSEERVEIASECSFKIDLIDKFKNRESIQYALENPKGLNYNIYKCVATDTGLYIFYETKTDNVEFKIKNLDVTYDKFYLGREELDTYYCLIQYHISMEKMKDLESFEVVDSDNNSMLFVKL